MIFQAVNLGTFVIKFALFFHVYKRAKLAFFALGEILAKLSRVKQRAAIIFVRTQMPKIANLLAIFFHNIIAHWIVIKLLQSYLEISMRPFQKFRGNFSPAIGKANKRFDCILSERVH